MLPLQGGGCHSACYPGALPAQGDAVGLMVCMAFGQGGVRG